MVNNRNMADRRSYRPLVKTSVITVCAITFALFEAFLLAQGSKTYAVLALLLAVVPIAFYFGVKRPLVFPFAMFVALVPFDLLLGSQFGTLTKFFAALSGLAALVFLIRTKKAVPISKAVLCWGLLTLWILASVTWAADPPVSWHYIFTFLQLFALYIIISVLPVSIKDLQVLLVANVVGGTAAAVYGANYFLHQPAMAAMTEERLFRDVPGNSGTAVDPNFFAVAMILPIAIAVMSVLRTRRLMLKALYALPLGIMLVTLFFTGSRGAILAISAMFLYFFWRTRYKLQIGLVLVASLASSFIVAPHIWTRFAEAGATGGAHRVPIWHIGLVAFQHHWLIGAGVGNFISAYDEVFLQAAAVFTGWSRGPHNILLQAAVELGIIGLLLMLVAWIWQFKLVANITKRNPAYDIRVALEGATIALFVASMFLGDILITKFAWSTFMMLGILRSYTFQLEPASSQVPGTAP